MSLNPIDANERSQALDVRRSFIIQAPAGSGKTELLIQRILALLAEACEEPEQIVAITFTRKAAAEMRQRLIKALNQAQTQAEPSEDHAKITWRLAKAVLDVDAQRGWQLQENPSRLRLQTIDSLCASIAGSAPYLSRFGAEPSILKNPKAAYEEAARALLSGIDEPNPWQNALSRLLLHCDNDWSSVQRLLTKLLGRRDQWLGHLLDQSDAQSKRERLENSLKQVVLESLAHLHSIFPEEWQAETLAIVQSAAQVLAEKNPENNFLEIFLHQKNFPQYSLEDHAAWKALARFFLAQNGRWRRSFNVSNGILAPSSTKVAAEKEERQALKARLADCCTALNDLPGLVSALNEALILPPPEYSEAQWQILSDLVLILPILAAQLQIVFSELGGVDFIEVATRAREALGAADNPSDLALNWDYRIQHILVDEFQDTATPQWQLLESLTAGWQDNDGRTLFLVGDPMQSIYRFREAEVGLFLRAQRQGIGQIKLAPLQLKLNFRSEPQIIEWINQTFTQTFPQENDISVGAITYSASHSPRSQEAMTLSMQEKAEESHVKLHPLLNATEEQEADHIVGIIREAWQKNPQTSIAILVRARQHSSALFSALQAENIPYQAQDMEKLAHRMVIQDCFSLTRALLHPADQIAWLSILRAPWCGLSLTDLLVLSQTAGSNTLSSVLKNHEQLCDLSSEAQTRLKHVVPILSKALQDRHRYALRDWIQKTWEDLGGPACIKESPDFYNAERYFKLLEEFSLETLYDLNEVQNQLYQLFASVDPEADERLQIMTMHKSKGLEFDLVILPSLERSSVADPQQLLMWWERPRAKAQGLTDLILAPIKSSSTDEDAIYRYCRTQESLKTQYETNRVLYVAATRAKKSLHLICKLKADEDNNLAAPPSGSFLKLLWPAIEENLENKIISVDSAGDLISENRQTLWRLPLSFLTKTAAAEEKMPNSMSFSADHKNNSKTKLELTQKDKSALTIPAWHIDQSAEQIGTVIHGNLERIAKEGLNHWNTERLQEAEKQWKVHLLQLGLALENLESALEIVGLSLKNTLGDERGRWILSPHKDHQSEFPLSWQEGGEIQHGVIDRTFIDSEGTRWIIDYKSSYPKAGQSPQVFLEQAFQYHAPQLHGYAQALSALEQKPIQLALYFPRCTLFYQWTYSPTQPLTTQNTHI